MSGRPRRTFPVHQVLEASSPGTNIQQLTNRVDRLVIYQLGGWRGFSHRAGGDRLKQRNEGRTLRDDGSWRQATAGSIILLMSNGPICLGASFRESVWSTRSLDKRHWFRAVEWRRAMRAAHQTRRHYYTWSWLDRTTTSASCSVKKGD